MSTAGSKISVSGTLCTFKSLIIMGRTYSSRGDHMSILGGKLAHFFSNFLQIISNHWYLSKYTQLAKFMHEWYIFSCPLLKCNIFFKYGNGGLFLLINRNLDLPKSRVSDPLLSSQEKESRSETFDLGKWNWNKMFVDRWFSKINSFSKLLLVLYKGNFIEVETKSVNFL